MISRLLMVAAMSALGTAAVWERPTWCERQRPVFDAMRRVFQALKAPVKVDGRP